MKNILILCGGQSPEHEISIRSTKNILSALNRKKYTVSIIGISQDGQWRLVSEEKLSESITNQGEEVTIHPGTSDSFRVGGEILGSFDIVFPILHGPNGEDGTIQGLIKLLGIPLVGSSLLASAVAMDKDITKCLLRDAGLKVAKWELIRRGGAIPGYHEIVEKLGDVVFVKPANMGSSVGVHRVSSEKEWKSAIEDALSFDFKVLVEELVDGRELECAVLGNERPKASGVGEVQSGNFYSFEEKYTSRSSAEIVIPALIDSVHLPKLKEVAIKAYQTLNCEGMSRVDMFLTNEGEILVNEVNTIPGFTNISMYPKLWDQDGLSYSELLDQLIELGIARGV
ncbi:MAG: D-alanine--D-alanine ligase family protein [Ekhidna sp.]